MKKGFEIVLLGDLCEFKYGDSLPERKRILGKIPVYGSNGIVGYHNQSVTQGETIIVGRKGSIGEVHYSGGPCFPIDTTYYISETKRECSLQWLYYILRSLRLTELNKSSAVPGLNRNDAYEKKIIYPPLPIQKQIAAILEKADAAREKRRQANQLTEQFLQSAFLGMFGDPGTNPKGWVMVSLGDVTETITKGETPLWKGDSYLESGVLFLRSENVLMGSLDLSKKTFVSPEVHERMRRSQVKKNDVLLNIVGASIGRSAIFKEGCTANINQAISVIRPKPELLPSYLSYLLNTERMQRKFKELQAGVARDNLNLGQLRDLEILLPPISEQQKFAALVEKVESLRAKQKQSEKELQELFQSLMQRAFRGELV
jgi:type I restriction enzyme S subunit